ncbi:MULTISPECIES: lipoate--protein ligase [unclassified Streptococcus]|uniref:lipoate--protein ligase n=1 Tax=unclassified Streptococcus TaxID=2608887 RepID=UPI001072A67C|nr:MULTISPECIES: lipoate--protein ligase [unclassified Streptococcus]MBF0787357.1 lipoate--protein ligase [Streptococcus sp. 19428wC2_LYSM12]MCQ9211105.1 lipoate--protein ligase [Streptococcus sp. B01]MCQ9214380.1 lipoate--protein ligase [Streptococcus sp. O1]TFV05731.1 lipoate--protein ligase [Streptococcus sp. LYSM12]
MYLIEPIRNGQYIADGAVALAMQVYVQQHVFLDDDILFPYYCNPKVEIGKFQNVIVEINEDYLKENNILLVRRDTGGGAVYVDSGAVNVCYLIQDNGIFGDFKRAYAPAICALNELGVTQVEQTGRNDLVIEGKKVSGAAMTISNHRVYGGYSLLLDVDYEAMERVLHPNRKKIESKGIKSVKSRVGSIRPYLAEQYQDITTDEFKNLMTCKLLGIDRIEQAKRYELTEEDWAAIDQLVADKYKNWEWNYGNSPQYSYHRDGRFAAGTIDIHLDIDKGRIAHCRIYGDFFGRGDVAEVEQILVGQRMERDDISLVLADVDLSPYFGKVSTEELLDLMFS